MSYTNFTYSQPTKILFGANTENQIGGLLKEYGAKKVLITMDGGSYLDALLHRIKQSIEGEGIQYEIYSGCRSNPESQWVNAGAFIYKEKNCDFLLAIGGGSVIDATKGIAILVGNNSDNIWQFLTGEKSIDSPAAPLGVVLTIAATGSECDSSLVISNEETHDKILFTENSVLPRFSVCNPELTYSVGVWQTACGVSDILSHLLEQYLYCDNSCSVSDEMLLGLMKAVVHWGPIALSEPSNFDARANLMLSSTIAMNGLVGAGHDQNWLSHMVEHAVSAVWSNVAHGAGMACLMPCYLEVIADKDKFDKIARFGKEVFGVKEGKDCALQAVAKLREFLAQLKMPTSVFEMIKREPTDEELTMVMEKSLPWGDMDAGGYPTFTQIDLKNLFSFAMKG